MHNTRPIQNHSRLAALAGTVLAATAVMVHPATLAEGTRYRNPKQAGNLYAHNATNFLGGQELKEVFSSVADDFGDASINFKSVEILNGGEFPDLHGLDMLVYVVDGHAGEHGIAGQFGITNESDTRNPNKRDYDELRELIQFPYDEEISGAHTTYIDPRTLIEEMASRNDQGFPLGQQESSRNFSRDQILKLISELASHEIGHGLGAVHTRYVGAGYCSMEDRPREEDFDHIMGKPSVQIDQRFYEGNVDRMHHFIDTVHSSNPSSVEISNARRKYIHQAKHLLIVRD